MQCVYRVCCTCTYSISTADALTAPTAHIPNDALTVIKCVHVLQVALHPQLRYKLLSPFIVQQVFITLKDNSTVYLSLQFITNLCTVDELTEWLIRL